MRKTTKYLPFALFMLALPILFGFTDMDESHWAYDAVNQLVNDGAVSGFEDGSFRPNEPVTRAQFVKMTGFRTDGRRSDRGADLKTTHWAYDCLIHSPLRLVNGEALPDAAMTREQAAVYLYDCFAKNASSDAPPFVLGDTRNKTEVGWAYEHGIMVGDDGMNLRLSDTLTRAEAAALIVNSRDKLDSVSDFADNVPDWILEKVFNGSFLFDAPYEPDKALTNGEAARAAYRLRTDNLGGLWYYEKPDFEHEYASDLTAVKAVIGEENMNAVYASSPADMETALALLAYGMVVKVKIPHAYGDKTPTYADFSPEDNELARAVSFSYRNGVRPFSGGVMKGGTIVTHKMMAGLLLQYDAMWGLATSVSADGTNVSYADEPMRFTSLPANAGDYASILESIPNEVYEAEYDIPEEITAEDFVKPYVNYRYHSALKKIHASYLSKIANGLSETYGAQVKFTFYAPLVYDDGESFISRVKAEISSLGSAQSAQELFGEYTILADYGSDVWVELPVPFAAFIGGE